MNQSLELRSSLTIAIIIAKEKLSLAGVSACDSPTTHTMSNMLHSALALLAIAATSCEAHSTACSCSGAVANNVCYSTLGAAIDAAATTGTSVQVGGKHVLAQPVIVKGKSFTLEGVNCGGKATISAKMSAGEGGMIEAYGPGPLSINFKGMIFTREPGSGAAAAFRGGGTLFHRRCHIN